MQQSNGCCAIDIIDKAGRKHAGREITNTEIAPL